MVWLIDWLTLVNLSVSPIGESKMFGMSTHQS